MKGDIRGQTGVLAVVLLVGIVAVGSVAVLMFGSMTTAESKETAEVDRVKKGFVHLGERLDTVGRSDDRHREVDLDLPGKADEAVRKESTGRIVIERDNGTTEEVVNRTVGAITYSYEDERIAYQAGGVWLGTGNETQMVSAPEVSYQGGTLTFPITDVEGDHALTHGPVSIEKRRTVSPLNDAQIVTGEIVTLQITSKYYVGWANYFRERIAGVTVTVDHPNSTTTVLLAQPSGGGVFRPGIIASENVSINVSNSDHPNTRVQAGGTVDGRSDDNFQCPDGTGSDCITLSDPDTVPLDRAIELKTAAGRRCGDGVECVDEIEAGDTFVNDADGGVYYVENDSLLTGGQATIDLSSGNVTLIVDGHVGLAGGSIRTINGDAADAHARIYLNDRDLAIGQQGSFYTGSDNAARLQLYGTSETHIDVGQVQNGEGFDGAVYAPGEPSTDHNEATDLHSSLSSAGCDSGGDSYDICIGTGAGNVEGSLIGGSVKLSQSTNFTYDRRLARMHPTLSIDRGVFPAPITYLHVSVYEVEIRRSG